MFLVQHVKIIYDKNTDFQRKAFLQQDDDISSTQEAPSKRRETISFCQCNSPTAWDSRPDSAQVLSDAAQTVAALNNKVHICHPMVLSVSEKSSLHATSSPKMSGADGILVKTWHDNYAIYVLEIHLKAIFSNT